MNISMYNKHCCGCGECFVVCPTKAITMKKNKDGFFYPVVNLKKCIDCSLCINHCSFNNYSTDTEQNKIKFSVAVKHQDESVRENSRSGGIFTALSDWVLELGGVVYGCKLLDYRKAMHVRAASKEERDDLRGSKYIQSIVSNTFQMVKNDLKNDLYVLYSGTPCQINAIRDYCKDINCDKLILIDIVCHGVPSQKVWEDYVTYLSRIYKSKVKHVDFRDKKKFGWAAHKETFAFENGKEYSGNVFTKLFYSHLILRKDCFDCPYKNLSRVGDITIADCWGIKEHYPQFDDDKGVSLVIVNSEKGLQLWRRIEEIKTIEVDIDKVMQPCLKGNWDVPEEYVQFWKFYHRHSFKKVLDKYVSKKENWIDWLKWTSIGIAKKVKKIITKGK